jgi:hypothetical protein
MVLGSSNMSPIAAGVARARHEPPSQDEGYMCACATGEPGRLQTTRFEGS